MRMLSQLDDCYPQWERHWESRAVVSGREEMEQREEGVPWALHPDFGPVGVDIEFGWWPDGQRFRLDDEDRCVDGVHTRRRTIYRRVSEPPAPPVADERDEGRLGKIICILEKIATAEPAREVCLSIALCDDSRFEVAAPTPVQCARNHWGLAVGEELESARRGLRARRRAAGRLLADRFTGEVESAGLRVIGVTLAGRPRVRVVGLARHAISLLQCSEVESASFDGDAEASHQVDGVTTRYMCMGVPDRFVHHLDQEACDGGPPTPFLDTLNAATGVYAYLDTGFNGANVRGIASWAYYWDVVIEGGYTADGSYDVPAASQCHHLTIAVIDSGQGLDPNNLAFFTPAWAQEERRVRAWLGGEGFLRDDDVGRVPERTSGSHGTMVAGIALGSVMDGQDDRVDGNEAREARSGVARRAAAFFSEAHLSTTMDRVDEYDTVYVGTEGLDGLDVVSCSRSFNHSIVEATSKYQCPTDDDARGLDAESEAVVWAFLDKHVVTVKSAGNTHGVVGGCDGWGAVESEVSTPGASPAAIAVGALSSGGRTAAQIQSTFQLWGGQSSGSSGGRTGDGRAYPSLVVAHWQCGCPADYQDAHPRDPYGDMGATSGATPRVAGALLLFKHWYLEAHGSGYANQPGRLVAHGLNFADGFASNRIGTGPLTQVPSSGWGLGRFCLRLFVDDVGMTGDWFRGAASFTLGDGEYEKTQLAGGSGNGIPTGAQRLRITVWWLETNTGEGEERAYVQAWISKDGGDIVGGTWRETDSDNVFRWEFDCSRVGFASPPSGELHLTVMAVTAPQEKRYYQRKFRAFHLAWFWETGADLSQIVCPGAPPVRTC
ncbi:MAG: S8/S53 family peptidase [Deltaproteobacteria bacterium]|nr:S8/S53 family peptidase [Deltaproteobacteria bacterium]